MSVHTSQWWRYYFSRTSGVQISTWRGCCGKLERTCGSTKHLSPCTEWLHPESVIMKRTKLGLIRNGNMRDLQPLKVCEQTMKVTHICAFDAFCCAFAVTFVTVYLILITKSNMEIVLHGRKGSTMLALCWSFTQYCICISWPNGGWGCVWRRNDTKIPGRVIRQTNNHMVCLCCVVTSVWDWLCGAETCFSQHDWLKELLPWRQQKNRSHSKKTAFSLRNIRVWCERKDVGRISKVVGK